MPNIADFGTWASPITPEMLTRAEVGLAFPSRDRGFTYWLESRPEEGGRLVLMRAADEGAVEVVSPEGFPGSFNVRTRVHEYGGGAYGVRDGVILAVNFADQRAYRLDGEGQPKALTPASDKKLRFADFAFDPERRRVLAVREDHRAGGEPVNSIVALSLDRGEGEGRVLADGHDFFSSPRLSPDGRKLAWLTWDHPNMPWDGTTLWLAEVRDDGSLGAARAVAGGEAETVAQPLWSPTGELVFVSDRSGWWNLYRLGDDGARPICPMAAEFALPHWVFGQACYGFVDGETLLAAFGEAGKWQAAVIGLESGRMGRLDLPFEQIDSVQLEAGVAVMRCGAPDRPGAIIRLEPKSGSYRTVKAGGERPVARGFISKPEAITFETDLSHEHAPGEAPLAYAFFYPPTNPDFRAPSNLTPPLIVKSHGGPTGAASSQFNLATQFWTSRGFAVCDVNYGGSTGFGRAYRERLNGRWGEVDVEDCLNAARHLVAAGRADPARLAITGGSAGGFTTLAALTFHRVFKAGASHYGVSDLEALAKETHKFESRYLDRLIGPYPAALELYQARSPIHHVDRLACPMIFFQGLEDVIVPPNQAEAMVDALRAKGLPVAYLAFEGEQHGFRKADTIQTVRRAELAFYGRIFGFTPADGLGDLVIDNLD
jgi:dipeptidyl aminopeptidase/acylaminoacyl peptidase